MKEIIRHLHNSLTTTHYACAYHCQNIQATFVMHVYIAVTIDKHYQYSLDGFLYLHICKQGKYKCISYIRTPFTNVFVHVCVCAPISCCLCYIRSNVQCTRANHCQGGRVHAVKSTIRPIRASIKTLNLCMYFTCTRPPFRC